VYIRAYDESEAARIIDKLNGKKINLWKFKIEMLSAFMNLWDIVDGSKEPPPSNANRKVLKEYQQYVKKTMSIIVLNLADNQLAYIKSCKGPVEAWNKLCNIHKTKSLSNILFICYNFFTHKMQEGDDLLDHINKVKVLADQFAYLKVPVRDEDIVMTLLKSLLASYKYLITVMETMLMKDLTMDYVTVCLMHKMPKHKENDSQYEDAAMISRQT
jgi:hypothetical protein